MRSLNQNFFDLFNTRKEPELSSVADIVLAANYRALSLQRVVSDTLKGDYLLGGVESKAASRNASFWVKELSKYGPEL